MGERTIALQESLPCQILVHLVKPEYNGYDLDITICHRYSFIMLIFCYKYVIVSIATLIIITSLSKAVAGQRPCIRQL